MSNKVIHDDKLSRLARYMKKCRGSMTYREFSESIKGHWSYSFIALLEQDKKSTTQDNFVIFATELLPEQMRIPENDAITLWTEQKQAYEINKRLAKKVEELQAKGLSYKEK